MRARITQDSVVIPTSGLRFSVETQGAGLMAFDADPGTVSMDPADVLLLEVGDDTNGWVEAGRYVIESRSRQRVGLGLATYQATSLLEDWASHTIIYPEYADDTIFTLSGTDRGIGWMSTAYDWTSDPREDWDRCYNVTRDKPPAWPDIASSASWVSATSVVGDPGYGNSERKIFRSDITVTGSGPQLVKFYFSSDEGAALWVAAERIMETSYTEEGRNYTEEVAVVLYPGTYAIGIDTKTHVTKGGDGVDPVICAAFLTDANGDPTGSPLIVTNATTWGACRRNDEGPGSDPPGPTPGAVLGYLLAEAQARTVAGWTTVTADFDDVYDSYGDPWEVSTERLVRVGMDDYWQLMRGMAEVGEAEVWMEGLTLRAAPIQGEDKSASVTLGETVVSTMSDTTTHGSGTLGVARTYGGWVQVQTSGQRREVGLEVGQALDLPLGQKVAQALVDDTDRWDGQIQWVPPSVALPFDPGDIVLLDYADLTQNVRVLAIGGEAGEGGLLWTLDVTEDV